MNDNFSKLANKIGAVALPGGTVQVNTQNIDGQKKLTPTKDIPYRGSVHFVGRETELTTIHEDLRRGNYVAITGMVDTPRSKDAGILNRIIVKTTARIISAFQVLP
jgi:hypothetical protein